MHPFPENKRLELEPVQLTLKMTRKINENLVSELHVEGLVVLFSKGVGWSGWSWWPLNQFGCSAIFLVFTATYSSLVFSHFPEAARQHRKNAKYHPYKIYSCLFHMFTPSWFESLAHFFYILHILEVGHRNVRLTDASLEPRWQCPCGSTSPGATTWQCHHWGEWKWLATFLACHLGLEKG